MMTSSPLPRLILADSNPLVVKALTEVFESSRLFARVETSLGGVGVLEKLADGSADVAVAGWRLGDMTAGDLLQSLKLAHAPMKITVLAADQNQVILRRCIQLGAMGFCWQSDAPEVLVNTVLAVHSNRMCLPYVDIGRVDQSPLASLTSRERDLLKALSDGWSNVQIAARFGISENTVKYHLKNTYDKLGVRNRVMAITLLLNERQSEG